MGKHMAGLPTIDPTLQNAQDTIGVLETARTQLRGTQQGAIRDLFSYDKALSDRYSSPDSKMYIENAQTRQDIAAGYNKAGREEITNLYDIMDKVRKSKEELQALLDKNKAGAGGSGGYAPSDFLQLFQMEGDIPEPPAKVLADLKNHPGYTLYYGTNPDGSTYWEQAPKGQPSQPDAKDYFAPRMSDIVQQQFGLDKATVAKLAALEAINPKLAKSTLNSLLTSGVKPQNLSSTELQAGVNEADTSTQRNAKVQEYLKSKQNNRAETEADFQAYLEAAKQKGYTRDEIIKLLEPSFQDAKIPGTWRPLIDQVFPIEGGGGIIDRVKKAGAAIMGGK